MIVVYEIFRERWEDLYWADAEQREQYQENYTHNDQNNVKGSNKKDTEIKSEFILKQCPILISED